MSVATHTPGNWCMSEGPFGRLDSIRQEETGRLICEVPYGFDGEDAANARLIAAAPKMLDVLQQLVRYEALANIEFGLGEDIRAAIAQATGAAQS